MTYFLIGLLLWHFAMTLVYISPRNFFNPFINTVSDAYMLPFFHQSWSLFAPDPPRYEKSLQYKVKVNDVWKEWIDPGSELLQKHDACRLSPDNILFRVNQNTAWRLWHDVEEVMPAVLKRFPDTLSYLKQSRAFHTAVYYANASYRKSGPEAVADSLKIRLLITIPPTVHGETGDTKPAHYYINFPTVEAE